MVNRFVQLINIIQVDYYNNFNNFTSSTLFASSEKAVERSVALANSVLSNSNFSDAPGPLISICFADASFFIFVTNRNASSKKFIFNSFLETKLLHWYIPIDATSEDLLSVVDLLNELAMKPLISLKQIIVTIKIVVKA